MAEVRLTVYSGNRLHFSLDVGSYGGWLSGKLNNEEKMILHLIKDLKWKAKFKDGDCLFVSQMELEADGAAEDLVDACKELAALAVLEA